MTADFTARVTEILRGHRWRGDILGCGCGWNWPQERTYFCGEDERIRAAHEAHVADLIAVAAEEHYRPRVETVEQLDALPFHTVIQRDAPRSVPLWKTNHLWCFGDRLLTDSREVEGHLPAVVLWSPGAGA